MRVFFAPETSLQERKGNRQARFSGGKGVEGPLTYPIRSTQGSGGMGHNIGNGTFALLTATARTPFRIERKILHEYQVG